MLRYYLAAEAVPTELLGLAADSNIKKHSKLYSAPLSTQKCMGSEITLTHLFVLCPAVFSSPPDRNEGAGPKDGLETQISRSLEQSSDFLKATYEE